MPTLLQVLASPRGDYSVSRALAAKFVEKWSATHVGGDVVTRDLFQTELPFVDVPWIMGAYTPAEQHSPEIKKAIAVSDTLTAELKAADHILIATPMYNFSTPAVLKAYIDHIARLNVTFTSSYEGLVKGKKVVVIITSGGEYGPGAHAERYNVESSYLRQVLGFLGMTDLEIVLAGGTSAIDQGKVSKDEIVAKHAPDVVALVK